ncbi:hypothetical protein JCM11251_001018 [Rhodosporidiobolus azoricus]
MPSARRIAPLALLSLLTMGKESPLPLASSPSPHSSRHTGNLRLAALILLLPIAVWLSVPADTVNSLFSHCSHHTSPVDKLSLVAAKCPAQPTPLSKGQDWKPEEDGEYVKRAVERLQGAVRVRTESFDNMGSPYEDSRFDVYGDLHKYLESTFPRVYERLDVEKVQKWGLLLTWKGKEDKLKPVVLMAHQDTVPVPDATLSRWTYPPFEAHQDEEGWIWGRGTTDCRNTLVGIFAALDKLIEEGYEPTRTVILSSGFDEEIGGGRSAAYLASTLQERYGESGIALVVDEGFTGVDSAYGGTYARFGMGEKGAVSITLDVLTEGGHSSVPRGKHTGIGILARLLVALEDHPDQPKLEAGNPLLQQLACAAEYGDLDKETKRKLKNPRKWKQLAEQLAHDDILRAFLSTTQAEDLVHGGVKINALPELASASVNYRISFLSSVNATLTRISSILEPVVHSLNLTFSSYGSHSDVENNVVRLSMIGDSGIEPAPLTPAEGPAWELMAGTTKKLWPEAIIAPSAMIANTDTKYSWKLTPNIYRFVPGSLELIKNFHTVDERIHIDAHLTGIRWFRQLILNTEGWETD